MRPQLSIQCHLVVLQNVLYSLNSAIGKLSRSQSQGRSAAANGIATGRRGTVGRDGHSVHRRKMDEKLLQYLQQRRGMLRWQELLLLVFMKVGLGFPDGR